MKDFPLIRSGKAALIGFLLLAVPMLLLSLTPITGIYVVLFVLFVLPMGLCLVSGLGGLIPGMAGLLCGLIACQHLLGVQGLAAAAIYLIPVFAVFHLILWQKLPFFKGCSLMIVTHILAFSCVYLYAQQLFDHQLYQAVADMAVKALAEMPECDILLIQMYQMGVITLPDALQEQLRILPSGLYFITPAAKQDLLLSIGALVENFLVSMVMLMMAQHAIISGVACLLLPQRFGKIAYDKQVFLAKEGKNIPSFPDLNMPPLSLWHIPRGMGWKVGLAWVAGSLLQATAQSTAAAMAGSILYYGATALFTWQGAALLNFTQKARGTKRPFRVMIPLLFYALGILPYMGIFDQIINLRGLRKPPEPKEEI